MIHMKNLTVFLSKVVSIKCLCFFYTMYIYRRIPYLKKGPIFNSCERIKKELVEYDLPTISSDILLLDSIIDQSYEFLERIKHYRTERKKIP